jgi:hypothetical protein
LRLWPFARRPAAGHWRVGSEVGGLLLIWIKALGAIGIYLHSMRPFLFRCPVTALNVQSFIAGSATENDDDTYEPVKCTACTRIHLVNPNTGKVLGIVSEKIPGAHPSGGN